MVNMSQMTATSTAESRQQYWHWFAEHVIDWSPIPAVHVRPTVFLENPLFTVLAAQSIREQDVLALPFGAGRTSPVAGTDVADAVFAILDDPGPHLGHVYELTGPTGLDVDGLAEQYGRALELTIRGQHRDVEDWERDLGTSGLDDHVREHISTMARLHRADRYKPIHDRHHRPDRAPRTVRGGRRAQSPRPVHIPAWRNPCPMR